MKQRIHYNLSGPLNLDTTRDSRTVRTSRLNKYDAKGSTEVKSSMTLLYYQSLKINRILLTIANPDAVTTKINQIDIQIDKSQRPELKGEKISSRRPISTRDSNYIV